MTQGEGGGEPGMKGVRGEVGRARRQERRAEVITCRAVETKWRVVATCKPYSRSHAPNG